MQTLDYYPYGGSRIKTGQDVSSREYIGEVVDTSFPLSYLNARYMDSSRGQFLSQDPVFWENQRLQNPQSLNTYSYGNGNPINMSDSNGRSADDFSAFRYANAQTDEWLEQKIRNEIQGYSQVVTSILDFTPVGSINEVVAGKTLGGEDVSPAGRAIAVLSLVAGPAAKAEFKALQAVNKNSNNAVGNFGIYMIKIGEDVFKYGKADLDRITKSSGLPTRLHQQLVKLGKKYDDVKGVVVKYLNRTTTGEAKKVEQDTIEQYVNKAGSVPEGNKKSFSKDK